MEKFLSENDKMRKAEEIYYRRNNSNIKFNMMNENIKPKKTYLGSKILLEVLILAITAVVVFAIKNKDFVFTKEFLDEINSYNIDLSDKLKEYIVIDENSIITNNTVVEDNKTTNTTQEIQVDATNETLSCLDNNIQISTTEELKNNIQFQRPIDGIVTSRFGSRTSSYKNVGSNHTGIDIAADLGTPIKATMNGIVEQVSTEGDYGNHIKISQNNICTLYAHCQKIYVEEGQEIVIGQEIATVGSTGNSTGPHLHFEIRIDNNPIDPTEIIEF